jgi:hypothetical protein
MCPSHAGALFAALAFAKSVEESMRLRLSFIAVILVGSSYVSGEEPISMTVRPAVATTNSAAQIKVLVPRSARNRALRWEVDGPGYFRSSTLELNGAKAPAMFMFVVRNLPEGEVEIRAIVRRSDDSEALVRRQIVVMGSGP